MKSQTLRFALFSLALATMAGAAQDHPPDPRPDYMPSTPPAEKAISAYTPGDVLGAVITTDEHYPAEHPCREGNLGVGLRANWPGAKVATNIDAMIEFVLAAPPSDPSPLRPKSKLVKRLHKNVIFAIHHVMDIPDSEKADALVRVVNAQTDPQKLKHAKALAALMFEALLDPRLLAYEIEGLDDLATFAVCFECEPKHELPVRWFTKKSVINSLENHLQMDVDTDTFWTTGDAANCAALKAWLTANWTAIANKCTEVKANPERKRPPVDHQPWDARW